MPIAVGDVWGSTLGVGLDAGTYGAHKGVNQACCLQRHKHSSIQTQCNDAQCWSICGIPANGVTLRTQAGNKSLWGFRSDIGVPGYTGFCPSSHSVKIPHKGFEHTGRPVDGSFKASLTTATVDLETVKVSE